MNNAQWTAAKGSQVEPNGRAAAAGRVAVYGDGHLACSLDVALGGSGVVKELPEPGQYDLVVVAEQTFSPALLPDATRSLRSRRCAGLPVHATWEAVTIGPILTATDPGCYFCADHRMRMARSAGPLADRELWERFTSGALSPPEPVLTSPLLALVAALVAEEQRLLHTGHSPRTLRTLLRIDASALTVSQHLFLPCPQCEVCGSGIPDDSAELAILNLQPRLKPDPSSFRVGPASRHTELIERFVDARSGLVPMVYTSRDGHTVNAAARIRHADAHSHDNGLSGYGRTLDYGSSVTVALLEVLERYAGVTPDLAKRTTVRASYQDLPEGDALDPQSLGLPPPELAEASRHFVPYQPDLAMNWVWGWSFRHRRPMLVPESAGYYHHRPPAVLYECSSGCALGSCLEEAILHAIFEVAERDGFLITWYAHLPVPRIDWRSVSDPVSRLLATRLEAKTGCRLHLLNTTMPDSIPSVAAVVLNEDDRPGQVMATVCGGAHVDPERAINSAIREATMTEVRRPPTGTELARIQAMLADPDLVTDLDHHAELYLLPEAAPRLEFLTRGPCTTLDEAFPPEMRYTPSPDLSDDLRHTVERFLDHQLDVIVVDQTIPEQRAAGLACVKAIIPGTLPMTFGHRHRRTAGFPRLHELPVRLGYRSEPLPPAEINPHPHPFP